MSPSFCSGQRGSAIWYERAPSIVLYSNVRLGELSIRQSMNYEGQPIVEINDQYVDTGSVVERSLSDRYGIRSCEAGKV